MIYKGDHMSMPVHIWEYLQFCWNKQHKLALSQAKQNTQLPSPNPKEDGFVSCHPTEWRFKVESCDLKNKVSELQVDLAIEVIYLLQLADA